MNEGVGVVVSVQEASAAASVGITAGVEDGSRERSTMMSRWALPGRFLRARRIGDSDETREYPEQMNDVPLHVILFG
jgi:hypothetical protein